jgi:GNAT superfamily N-acetyltransferase
LSATTAAMAEPLDKVIIRTVGVDDAGALAALRSTWSIGAGADRAFEERIRDWLASEGERHTAWLAWVDGLAVGMVSMLEYRRMPQPGRADSRWAYVSNMFVCADVRGRGIGTVQAFVEAGFYVENVRGTRPTKAAIDQFRCLRPLPTFPVSSSTDLGEQTGTELKAHAIAPALPGVCLRCASGPR